MKKAATAALLLLLALIGQACASTGFLSQTGPALITSVTEGDQATTESDTHRTGKACSHNILGIYGAGDSSIDKAKIDGDVLVVSSVDKQYVNILFLYGRVCTIVKGK